jgi:hypothetical protein
MKAILHIGQQKTGSTSLQYFWEKNRKQLLKKGVLYPKSLGNNKQVKIFTEHEQIVDPDSSVVKAFLKERDKGEISTVLLSEENLYVCKPHIKEHIKQFLLTHFEEIEIVVYLRRQEEHIPSHYQQAVKGKVGLSLSQWINKMVKIKKHYYQYDQVLGVWAALLPQAEIIVVPFSIVKEQSLYTHCLSYLKIDSDGLSMDVSSLNQSWDRRSIELFRIINSIAKEDPDLVGESMRSDLRRYILDNLQQQSKTDKIVLSQEQLNLIYESTHESNQRLLRAYEIDVEYHPYFLDRKSAKTGLEDIETDELFKLLFGFLTKKGVI